MAEMQSFRQAGAMLRASSWRLVPYAAFAGGGLMLGFALWLWSRHGLSVYLTQMANFAMTCF
jgi:hypothetical protein